MIRFQKFLMSETGKKLFSIMLGLGVAGLFKMSCDSRSCLVYKAPEFKETNKTVKYNEQCYGVQEKMIDCEKSNNQLVYT